MIVKFGNFVETGTGVLSLRGQDVPLRFIQEIWRCENLWANCAARLRLSEMPLLSWFGKLFSGDLEPSQNRGDIGSIDSQMEPTGEQLHRLIGVAALRSKFDSQVRSEKPLKYAYDCRAWFLFEQCSLLSNYRSLFYLSNIYVISKRRICVFSQRGSAVRCSGELLFFTQSRCDMENARAFLETTGWPIAAWSRRATSSALHREAFLKNLTWRCRCKAFHSLHGLGQAFFPVSPIV